jgi:signal transduction histidine kinase
MLHKDSFQHPFEKFIGFFEKAADGEMQVFEWISKDRFEREFWVEMSIKRVIIGGQYRFLCVVRDVTERKQAMMQKEKFINMVSHELRTPLAAIKESISIIINDTVGATNNMQHEVLEIGKSNIDRLSRLIDQVLDFQKISAGRMEFKFKENNINDVVREVQRSMLSTVSKKRLKFILKLDNKLPTIKFDEDKIIEVLNNLVNNAVKFTATGSIVITTSLGNGFVQVQVSDTGIGIKKGDMSKLFQSFSQLEGKSGGTGLGLAICKELIEKHKGKIWAESEFGKGSTFTFILPLNERVG